MLQGRVPRAYMGCKSRVRVAGRLMMLLGEHIAKEEAAMARTLRWYRSLLSFFLLTSDLAFTGCILCYWTTSYILSQLECITGVKYHSFAHSDLCLARVRTCPANMIRSPVAVKPCVPRIHGIVGDPQPRSVRRLKVSESVIGRAQLKGKGMENREIGNGLLS